MTQEKFEAVMILLVPKVVQMIAESYSYDEMTASKEFYGSKVYAILEQEDTKLWHLSAPAIFSMFDSEKKTGSFDIPEEV
ncbi:MAG: hypothetical protein IK118_00400 [Clostridia bacterium]|nr:hypothetical protein [Clostridia bacterium]MBR5426777.1 hypothetical protein [Clostridia bacterium]